VFGRLCKCVLGARVPSVQFFKTTLNEPSLRAEIAAILSYKANDFRVMDFDTSPSFLEFLCRCKLQAVLFRDVHGVVAPFQTGSAVRELAQP
jgi:hypothetical protein